MLVKPNLNKPAFTLFVDAKKLIEENRCPICKKQIKEDDFKTEISKREYSISGMCQDCQDDIWKEV